MGARAGHFPGCSLGSQAPSLTRGVPTPSPDPRRTPASRHKRPTSSMELGHMGPGCEQQAYVAGNTQTPPSGPHHCEDPPVLPSVKGSPFTVGRTGGRPPGDGFYPSRGWLVSGQDAARQAQGRPPPEASLGATCPTLEISSQVHRVPGVVSVELHPLPAPRRPERFPMNHTSRQVSHPRKGTLPREELGTRGLQGGPATVPRQVEQARATLESWMLLVTSCFYIKPYSSSPPCCDLPC